MSGIIKICGLSTPETLDVSLDCGADMVGFVFFPKSPRHLSLSDAAALSRRIQGRAQSVALSVNAEDDMLAEIVAHIAPQWLQLHGAESPQRVAQIKARFGCKVMKAIGISAAADLNAAQAYASCADKLLFDAKPPKNAALPGGNGQVFDWTLLRNCPFPDAMLSGGLDPSNVAQALSISGLAAVDVSSGVESAPGVKDSEKIQAFVRAARAGFKP